MLDGFQGLVDLSKLDTDLATREAEKSKLPARRESCAERKVAAEARLEGAYFVGGPDQVVEKILYQHELFGHDRFLIQLTVGPMPHERVIEAIRLLGEEVAPAVRRAVAPSPSDAAGTDPADRTDEAAPADGGGLTS